MIAAPKITGFESLKNIRTSLNVNLKRLYSSESVLEGMGGAVGLYQTNRSSKVVLRLKEHNFNAFSMQFPLRNRPAVKGGGIKGTNLPSSSRFFLNFMGTFHTFSYVPPSQLNLKLKPAFAVKIYFKRPFCNQRGEYREKL